MRSLPDIRQKMPTRTPTRTERTLTEGSRSGRGIIINADDFGDPRFHASILAGFAAGFISSASLLVNAPGTRAAIAEIRRLDLCVGLHVNLTTFGPLSPPAEVPTLVGPDGAFHGPEGFVWRLQRGMIEDDDLVRECSAQIERFRALAGRTPSHVDGHHHVHADPTVALCLAPLMARHRIARVRAPIEDPRYFHHIEPDRRRRAIRIVRRAEAALPIYGAYGCSWPDGFMGMGLGWSHCTVDAVTSRLRTIPNGITEYMVHILRLGTVPSTDPAYRRHHEYEVVSGDAFATALQRSAIKLVPYAAVGDTVRSRL